MFSLVLLAALTLGQESFSPETGRPYYVVKLHTVKHDGLTFTVRGYVADPATGTVTWETADPFNARSYADAKARSLALNSARARRELRHGAGADAHGAGLHGVERQGPQVLPRSARGIGPREARFTSPSSVRTRIEPPS